MAEYNQGLIGDIDLGENTNVSVLSLGGLYKANISNEALVILSH